MFLECYGIQHPASNTSSMSRLELMAYHSWHGPLRRPFRAIARRLTGDSSQIVWGPLKGKLFTGEELIYRLGIYELHVQYALEELLHAGDVFYDVGANNGYLSLLAAQRVETEGIVYAFEPLPQNALRMQTLMAVNRIGNYQLIEKAVSNKSGTIEFYLGDDGDPYTPSLIRDSRGQSLNVMATTLDDFAADHSWPDLIKMDIEGAEAMALEGATKLLNDANAPNWLIEVHSVETDRQVRSNLLKHGYHLQNLPAPLLRKQYPTHLIALKKVLRTED
jgi:FkbM family methyltransferase